MPIVSPEKDFEKIAAKLVCESCGNGFDCGANVGECWCFEVEVTPEILTELRGKYKNCLCAKCLPV
ncbi:MAG: cysteine-rich CWC family protein, partial [Pyrinomonadaceae bacterium]|nr:cysteine-rich CWC family protein [Pyrinomonadaceae bacterium]